MIADRVEILACSCHSAWYAYTVLALGEPGDPWISAPAWQKDSIRAGVRFWDAELQACMVNPALLATNVGLTRELVRHLAPLSHENWLKDKEADGWVYGEAKDPAAKTHPCMVPYEQLPEAQRKKDEVVLQAYLSMVQVFSQR